MLVGASWGVCASAGLLTALLACEPSGSSQQSSVSRALRPSPSEGLPGRAAAPGGPGSASTWANARKSFVGTSASRESRVYFTGHRGVVSEVFYPVLDAVQTVELELLVGDAAGSFLDEEKAADYVVTRPDARSLRWRVVTENAEHGWRITKDVFTDPGRDALIQQVRFDVAEGRDVSEFELYVRHDPALDNSGAGDSSRTRRAGGHTFLVASDKDRASALGVSLPWASSKGGDERRPMLSSGFVGASDGLTDLWGTGDDRRMDWTYDSAADGNVAQLGRIELGAGPSRQLEVVLAFGVNERDAMSTALSVLKSDVDASARRYDAGWHAYTGALDDQGGTADDRYYLSAMTLQAVRDKQTGAMIAAMGTPWGETRGDADNGGYHLVWPRDLFKFANALLTAGDVETGRGAVNYLFRTLMQTNDCGVSESEAEGCPGGYARNGRFPQNAWLNGHPYWTSTQLDEQAMPILLAWRVYELGDARVKAEIDELWPRIRATAELILDLGPWTAQERWEESSGYSPSTIAAEIAGLVAAAEFARLNGDAASAGRYLAVADDWQRRVGEWTFTTTGPHGNGRYYLRLNPSLRRGGTGLARFEPVRGPDAPLTLAIGNGGGEHDQRHIVDGGFLELVRLGVKAPDDPLILDSLPEYDAVLKQSIPGKGDAWFRYNFDGYGETDDGGPWDGVSGHGRLWPIFTAERGMYEVARSARGASGAPYLPMLRAFATAEGFIPEQVWDQPARSSGSPGPTRERFVPGTATGSVAPLSWAMGEYISLLASVRANRVVDIPASVCRRYDTCVPVLAADEVAVMLEVSVSTRAGQHLYVTGNVPSLGAGNADLGVPAQAVGPSLWRAQVELPRGRDVEYKLYARRADGGVVWETPPEARARMLTTPGSGALTVATRASFPGDAPPSAPATSRVE